MAALNSPHNINKLHFSAKKWFENVHTVYTVVQKTAPMFVCCVLFIGNSRGWGNPDRVLHG